MSHRLRFAGDLLIFLAAACAEREGPPTLVGGPPAANPGAAPPPSAAVRSTGADYAAALAAPGRSAEDREQDSWRKPAESLAFFGVQPGMAVLDLYSGAGYYTELLATVVGPTGHVVAHNNKAYLDGVGDELTRRFADPQRLANVERLAAENNAIELEPGSFDFVLLSAAYHDVYYVNEANDWPKIDGPKLLAELFDAHEARRHARPDRSCGRARLAGGDGRHAAPHRPRPRETRLRRSGVPARSRERRAAQPCRRSCQGRLRSGRAPPDGSLHAAVPQAVAVHTSAELDTTCALVPAPIALRRRDAHSADPAFGQRQLEAISLFFEHG